MSNQNTKHEHTKCNQVGCDVAPAYRFTWAGQDEAAICEAHSRQMKTIAGAMGYHIQMIPLDSHAQ